MKKIEICFQCDHEVLEDGSKGEKVEVVTQLGLLRQKALKVSICYDCFRLRYRDLRKTLVQQVEALKNALDPE